MELQSIEDRSAEYLKAPAKPEAIKTEGFLNEERTCLWKYLDATGIQIYFDPNPRPYFKTLLRLLYPFVLHVALLVNSVLLVLEYSHGVWDPKILLACASFNMLAIGVWHCFRRKRHDLLNLLSAVHETGRRYPEFRTTGLEVVATNLSVAVYSVTPTVFSLVCVYYASDKSIDKFWTYSYHPDHFGALVGRILLFLNVNLYIFLQVVFPGLATCIYCVLCHRLTLLLSCCRRKLVLEHPSMSSKQMVAMYLAVVDLIDMLQTTFSSPLFILVLMHLLHMFCLLAYFLTFSKDQFSAIVIGESVVILLTSTSSIVAVNVFAPKVSSGVQDIKDWFQRRQEKAVLSLLGKQDDVMSVVRDREVVVLSACEILYFRKSFIFSVFGALLTYSLLILQIQK